MIAAQQLRPSCAMRPGALQPYRRTVVDTTFKGLAAPLRGGPARRRHVVARGRVAPIVSASREEQLKSFRVVSTRCCQARHPTYSYMHGELTFLSHRVAN